MADQEIKTSIDGLITYLNEHGETNISYVASALGVGEATIIEWSNILEKANMIKIVNKSGRMFLSPIVGARGITANGSQFDQADQSHVEEEVASQIAVVNQISAKIDQFSKSVAAIDDVFKTKYKNIKPVLDRVNSIQNRIDDFEKRMGAKAKQIEELSMRMQKEFDSLEKYSVGLSSFNIDTNNARAVSDDIKSRLKTYESSVKDMSKAFDEVVYKYRKNSLEEYRTIKEKSAQLEEIVKLEDGQIREYERTARDYKRDSERMVRQAEQRKKALMDDISKTTGEVSRLGSNAEKDIASLKESVEDLKKGLGGIAGLNDNMFALKKDIAEITTQKNAMLDELNIMMQDAKFIGSVKKPADKQAKTSKLKEHAENVADKVSSLKKSAEKVGEDFSVLGNDKQENKGAEENKKDGLNG